MKTSTPSLTGLSLTEKKMLLAHLLQERAAQSSSEFPLSHGQRGLWFLHQMDGRSAAYNVSYPSRIRSPLDLPAFRRAVQSLVDRHPSLRTTFEERGGELLQRVHEAPPLPFEVIDASSWSEEVLRERLMVESHRPFDLEHGPLLRMHLFERAPDDHIFLLGVHHIVGDFWSLVLVIEEMRAHYPAECQGHPASLPRPARQYSDFVRWQSDLLAGPEEERLWSYWERQLAGAPTILDLPTDRPRPPGFSRRGDASLWQVKPELTRRLKAMAASEGVTLYATFLAAFQVLLGRMSGQDDFLVGSPFAGRNRPGFEGVIGYFINMLPLRADLSGDPPFRDLLGRVGATVLEALDHQDYPFSLLVERLKVGRDPSRTPLVQVSFTQDKTHRPRELGAWHYLPSSSGARHTVGGLVVEPYHVEHRGSQTDLEMVFEENDDSVEGMLRYNTDLFEPDTVERMARLFLTILEKIAEDPGLRLSVLPWLSEADRHLVLDQWNQTNAVFPRGICLHDRFETQAARTPDAIAVEEDRGSLTYAELDFRANRLANGLSRMGIGPGSFVALCLDRSPEMIVAILGTLKAGAAYVPLDPATPADRLHLILSDLASPVLLTCRALRDHWPETDAVVVCVDDPSFEKEDGSRPPDSGVQDTDLAYVIFTSGSTGKPKGVVVEHRAIGNTLEWRHRDLTIFAEDRVLYNVPYTFDPSLCLIFSTLAAGACLVLAAPGEEYDPSRQLRRVIQDRVTILEAPPAMLRLLVAEPLLGDCRTLRWVCCGGEAMPPDLPDRLFDRLDVDLFNLYGPTETAVDATWWRCRRDDPRPTVPIGRPIANARAYVLDENLQPVPPVCLASFVWGSRAGSGLPE